MIAWQPRWSLENLVPVDSGLESYVAAIEWGRGGGYFVALEIAVALTTIQNRQTCSKHNALTEQTWSMGICITQNLFIIIKIFNTS